MRKLNIVWKYCVLFFLLCTSCHIGDTKEKSALDRMVKQLKRIMSNNILFKSLKMWYNRERNEEWL